MAVKVEIVGVYAVAESEVPACLIELWVRGFAGTLDFGRFSQQNGGKDRGLDSVAYLEHVLSSDGSSGRELLLEPQQLAGDTRFAFFMHRLDQSLPLLTPFGPVRVPGTTARPDRLKFMRYCEVD